VVIVGTDWIFRTLVGVAFTAVLAWSAWAGKTAIDDGNRVTRLEPQREEDVRTLRRIEDKIDQLLMERR